MVETDMINLGLDGLLLLFLAAVLFACLRVNKRLADMRNGQAELADLVSRLEAATNQAKESLGHLRKESGAAEESLRHEAKRARALADELTLITEAGDNLAGRLEKKLTGKAQGSDARVTPLHGGKPNLMDKLKEAR